MLGSTWKTRARTGRCSLPLALLSGGLLRGALARARLGGLLARTPGAVGTARYRAMGQKPAVIESSAARPAHVSRGHVRGIEVAPFLASESAHFLGDPFTKPEMDHEVE
jgi:hypothetical protein